VWHKEAAAVSEDRSHPHHRGIIHKVAFRGRFLYRLDRDRLLSVSGKYMPVDVGALIFKEVSKLVLDAVKKQVSYGAESFFTKRRIENELEKSVLRVIEPLEPFLSDEKISETQQTLLIETCIDELRPLIEEPSRIFEGSLDGQKVVDQLYATKGPPTAIQEEGLQSTYFLLLPRIANLICSFPPAVKAWQIDGYKEGLGRLDRIAEVLRDLTVKVDVIATQGISDKDTRIVRIRHSLLQLAKSKIELAGLRPDRLIEPGNLEDFFVLPALSRDLTTGAKLTVQKSSEVFYTFLSQHRRELISGPPGSGKTTFATWLQIQQLSKPDPHLAVVVSLRDLKDGELPSLAQLVRESVGRHRADEIEPKDVGHWLDEGRITIICDGFDEVAPNYRDSVVQWLNELEAAAEASTVIITSRPLSTDHLLRLKSFTNHWEILPFDEPRVLQYIQRWYEKSTLLRGNTRQPDVGDLAKIWRTDPTIGPLTGNPLVLTTLLVVHHLDGNLPKGRAKLYERYIEGMLGSWDDKRKMSNIGTDVSRTTKHRILSAIALHFHLQEVDTFDEDQLLELVDKVVKENAIEHSAVGVLTVLRERTGLLIGPGTYSFVHKSVAEFLVAQAVIQGDQRDAAGERIDRMRIFKERHDDRWNTVLFFWAGLTGVGDFQDFIDSSLDVPGDSTFKLVFGLLYDQIERLPVEWTRRVVIRLLELGFTKSESGTLPSWLPPGTSNSDNIDLLPYPRGISSIDPRSALSTLIRACKLGWNDLAKSHSSALPAVWLAIVADPGDLENWQMALRVDPKEVPLPPNYYVFPLWRISDMISGEYTESEISNAIEIYQKSIPSRAGIVPFFLMSVFIDNMDSDPRSTDLPRSLTRLLDQIVKLTGSALDQEWLVESQRMTRVSVDYDDYDILTRFADLLEEAIRNRFISEAANIASVRNWLSHLNVTRGHLLEGSK
jgi:NACHT domain